VEVAGQKLTAAVDARHLGAGAAVQLGIRPEHMPIASEGAGHLLRGSLLHMERLGDSSLLYVQVGTGLPAITVKVEGSDRWPVGQTVQVLMRPQDLHLFDAQGVACARLGELPT
jgi:multiple sugar transport system ATP-binding protein